MKPHLRDFGDAAKHPSVIWEPAHDFVRSGMDAMVERRYRGFTRRQKRDKQPAKPLFLSLLLAAFLAFSLQPSAFALVVTFSWTNSSTGLLDTNDFKIIPLGQVRNADGTFNFSGAAVRYHNPSGATNIWLTGPQYYKVTNSITGDGFYIRTTDSGRSIVAAGDPSIYLGGANPFVELIINTNGGGGGNPLISQSGGLIFPTSATGSSGGVTSSGGFTFPQ